MIYRTTFFFSQKNDFIVRVFIQIKQKTKKHLCLKHS